MKKMTLVKTWLIVIGLPLLAGCAGRETTVYQPQPAGQTIIVQHRTEPPPLQSETIPPAPDSSDIWVRGAWEWHADHWAWVPGHWEPPNAGHEWVPGHWQHVEGGDEWIPGQWR